MFGSKNTFFLQDKKILEEKRKDLEYLIKFFGIEIMM